MTGQKHLIECHCYLKLFSGNDKKINHKFAVYSKFDNDGKVIPKLQKCNNCDALHYVYDICKSELRAGKDETSVTLDIEEMMLMLPERLSNIFIKNRCSLADIEHALDIIDEERWGEHIIMRRDIIDEEEQIKLVKIIDEKRFQIETKTIKSLFLSGE
mgnify:CR=1 FL=1|tara:strand:- start:3557 stop:4030 length:474 start_codon:yes stop_codon:yes gene_type:complete